MFNAAEHERRRGAFAAALALLTNQPVELDFDEDAYTTMRLAQVLFDDGPDARPRNQREIDAAELYWRRVDG